MLTLTTNTNREPCAETNPPMDEIPVDLTAERDDPHSDVFVPVEAVEHTCVGTEFTFKPLVPCSPFQLLQKVIPKPCFLVLIIWGFWMTRKITLDGQFRFVCDCPQRPSSARSISKVEEGKTVQGVASFVKTQTSKDGNSVSVGQCGGEIVGSLNEQLEVPEFFKRRQRIEQGLSLCTWSAWVAVSLQGTLLIRKLLLTIPPYSTLPFTPSRSIKGQQSFKVWSTSRSNNTRSLVSIAGPICILSRSTCNDVPLFVICCTGTSRVKPMISSSSNRLAPMKAKTFFLFPTPSPTLLKE